MDYLIILTACLLAVPVLWFCQKLVLSLSHRVGLMIRSIFSIPVKIITSPMKLFKLLPKSIGGLSIEEKRTMKRDIALVIALGISSIFLSIEATIILLFITWLTISFLEQKQQISPSHDE